LPTFVLGGTPGESSEARIDDGATDALDCVARMAARVAQRRVGKGLLEGQALARVRAQ